MFVAGATGSGVAVAYDAVGSLDGMSAAPRIKFLRQKGLAMTTVSDVMHQGSTLAKEAATFVRESPALAKEGEAFLRGLSGVVYGLPLVLMDLTRDVMTAAARSGEYSAPINQFHRRRDFVDPDFKNVVRISRNSLWSTAWLDLRDEPVVITYPPTRGHYMVVQAMNMWTDNFVSLGTRTTGTAGGSFLIAGPGWSGGVPPGVEREFRCSTRYAWVLTQIAAGRPEDLDEVRALEDEITVTPLSAWGSPYTPPAEVPVDPLVDTTTTPFDQVRLMDGPSFFARLAKALKDNPPYPADRHVIGRLERIGVRPGGHRRRGHRARGREGPDTSAQKGMDHAAVRAVLDEDGERLADRDESRPLWRRLQDASLHLLRRPGRAVMGGRGLPVFVRGPGWQAVERGTPVRAPPGEGRAVPIPERSVVDLGLSRELLCPQPDRALWHHVGDAARLQR